MNEVGDEKAAGRHDSYSDEHIAGILNGVKSVAVIGASANNVRPSYFVVKYLIAKGYDVYPINPGRAGSEICGVPAHASLADVANALDGNRIDMVDIFRRADALPGILEEIFSLPQLPKAVWMQLGIRDDAIASKLEAKGIEVIQNRCPKIEYGRLSGEIGWTGFNRRTISSKKPKMTGGFQHLGMK